MPGVGTTHNVKIGNDYFIVRPGSYRKRPAPLFGARFATGDPDYNNLSLWQHWAQTCWIGGMDAETWTDDSMYDVGVGVSTTEHEKLYLGRDLGPTTNRTAQKWDMGGTALEREFVAFNGKMYVVTKGAAGQSKLYRFNDATSDWTLVHSFAEGIRGVCAFGGYLIFGDGGTTLTKMDTAEAITTLAKPAGRTETPFTMRVFRAHLYVGFGRYIWRLKSNLTWDGTVTFYEAVGTNYVVAMETHLGFLYMASQNGHILRTDGNNTFDIWQWDGGVTPIGLRSFDGRLFVSTVEAEAGTVAGSGVIYQFTGSAVTELKRWGRVGRGCSPGRMRVAFRRLYYGASDLLGAVDQAGLDADGGFGIAVYDPVEDAHSIWASHRDTVTYAAGTNAVNYQVDDVFYWSGYMYASVRGYGIFRTPFTVHDQVRSGALYDGTQNGVSAAALNGGWLESSDFDGGTPGLRKLWRSIRVHADVPTNTTVVVDYSLDGGKTYTTAGTLTALAAVRQAKVFVLPAVVGTRFKYRVTLRSPSANVTPVVMAVIVSYLPQPEPNWMWEMTLSLAEKQVLLDGSVDDAADPAGKLSRLLAAFRGGQLVTFTEADGTVWSAGGPGALIHDVIVDMPFLGPTSDGPLEGDVRVVMLEAVEDY